MYQTEDGQKKKEFRYEQVANALESDIINNCYPDMKLPSEQILCDRYSASRTVVREAMKILSERKLISSVVGSGAYITRPEAADLSVIINRLMSTHNIDMLDVIEMRIILETNAAALAAIHATPEELTEMERICRELSVGNATLPVPERVNLDNRFHILLCEASHNSMLSILANAISNIVYSFIHAIMLATDGKPDTIRHISHTRILDALKDHNPIAANSIVYDHLYSTRALYVKYINSAGDK